jgi:hypothetical protein
MANQNLPLFLSLVEEAALIVAVERLAVGVVGTENGRDAAFALALMPAVCSEVVVISAALLTGLCAGVGAAAKATGYATLWGCLEH